MAFMNSTWYAVHERPIGHCSWTVHYMPFMNSALYAVHEQLKNICSWTFFVNHWCSWKVKTMAFMKSALYAVHEQCIKCRSWTVHYMPFMNSPLYAIHEQLKDICSWTFSVNHWFVRMNEWMNGKIVVMQSVNDGVHEQCIICRSWTVHYMPFMNS